MYFWERKNGIRDSDEKSAGCGILVKKEREYGIRTPLPDPDSKGAPEYQLDRHSLKALRVDGVHLSIYC